MKDHYNGSISLWRDGNRVYLSSAADTFIFEINTLEDKTREFCVYHNGEIIRSHPYDDYRDKLDVSFGKALQRLIKETL